MHVKDLADHLNAPWEGAGDTEIHDVADLASAGPDQIAFASPTKPAADVLASRAGCVLVGAGFPGPAGRTVIRVRDPRLAFAIIAKLFHPPKRPGPGIHPTAVVSATARLGDSVSVGPHSSIGDGATIGDSTVIGAGCRVGKGVVIGEHGLLYDNVSLYDHVEIGRHAILHSGVVIGDHVEIGANSCVDRAALGVTRIGDGTKLDNMVHVAHNVTIGKHVVIAAQTGISGGVVIEDYVVIGGQVGLGDKARIETRAVLGSGCGVLTSKIVRAGQTVWGTPARPLKEYLAQLAQVSRIGSLRTEVTELKKRLAALERS